MKFLGFIVVFFVELFITADLQIWHDPLQQNIPNPFSKTKEQTVNPGLKSRQFCDGELPVDCDQGCDCVQSRIQHNSISSFDIDDDEEEETSQTNGQRNLLQDYSLECAPGEIQPTNVWGLDRINQPSLPLDNMYSYNATGQGIHVYIISTGIRASHSEFRYFDGRSGSRVKAAYSFDGSDPIVDKQGFGTQAASIVGGYRYGVAKDVTMHSVKVFNQQSSTNMTDVMTALEWVKENAQKPAIVLWLTYGDIDNTKQQVIQELLDQGIPVITGAGERTIDACDEGPGQVPEAFTVSGTTFNDRLSPSANFGPCVDILAPGDAVPGAAAYFDNGMIIDTNSNTAPAHVAGAMANLMQEMPGLTPQQYMDILIERSTKDVIKNTKGTPNRLLYTGIKANKCIDLKGDKSTVNIELEQISCSLPEEISHASLVGNSAAVYMSFIVTFQRKLDENTLDSSNFIFQNSEAKIISISPLDNSNSCFGYRVYAYIPSSSAFESNSQQICLSIDGTKISDTCGQKFTTETKCQTINLCPVGRIYAYGMAYSPSITQNDAISSTNDNIIILSFSEPINDLVDQKVDVLGPELYGVQVLTNSTSNLQYVRIVTDENYQGPVTVSVTDLHSESGLQVGEMPPLTYDVLPAKFTTMYNGDLHVRNAFSFPKSL